MTKFLFATLTMLSHASGTLPSQSFLLANEVGIEEDISGNMPKVVMEDFMDRSLTPAKIVATEYDGKPGYYLIERNGKVALLLPRKIFNGEEKAKAKTIPPLGPATAEGKSRLKGMGSWIGGSGKAPAV